MINKIHVRAEGTRPLLFNSPRGMNSRDPLVQRKAELLAIPKKTQTDEHRLEIEHLDYVLALWYDPELGPYLPSETVHACLIEAGKGIRVGAKIDRGAFIDPEKIRLEYDGPRDVDELFNDVRFQDYRNVNQSGRGIMKIRPRFDEWACEFDVEYDSSVIDSHALTQVVLDLAGRTGVGSYRRRFGKFRTAIT